MDKTSILFAVAIIFLVAAVAITISSILRVRRMRRELDDQGIKLIQISNLYHEVKKTVGGIQSELSMMKDWFDRTNRSAADPGAKSTISAAVDERTLRMQGEGSGPGFAGFDASTRVKYKEEEEQGDDTARDVGEYFEGSGSDTNIRLASDEPVKANISSDEGGKKIKLKKRYREFDDFVRKYRKNLTKVGIFYPSSDLLPVGTRVELDFSLSDGSPILSGTGEVKRLHRETGGAKRNKDGMDIRFIYLDQASKDMVKRIVSGKYE